MASLEAWLEEHEKYRSVDEFNAETRRRHGRTTQPLVVTVPGCLAMVLLNAAVSYGIVD